VSGLTVRIRLRKPQGYTATGQMFVKPEHLEWQTIHYLTPDQCEHQETACRSCLETWELDWDLDLDNLSSDEQAAAAQRDVDQLADRLDQWQDDRDAYEALEDDEPLEFADERDST